MSESVTQGDIKFYQSPPEFADIKLSAENTSEIILDDGLENYVLLSLSTNARARDTDVLPSSNNDKQGWWGDVLEDTQIGSRLWLRSRDKLSNHLLPVIRQDAMDSLQWLITDGIVDSVECLVSRNPKAANEVLIAVYATKKDVGQIGFSYFFNWQNQVFRRGTINAV